MEKVLGKITFAEFGTMKDYPFLMGLQLGFSTEVGSVMDGGMYTVNISKECRWEESLREKTITIYADKLCGILKDAKVSYVSELVGKPVEVTLDKYRFKDFQILTEVL